MIASYQSRLFPLKAEEERVWLTDFCAYTGNLALYGWSPAITALFGKLIAVEHDGLCATSEDLAVLTSKDSPLHCLIDMIGLSRHLGERLMFHEENSGYGPLQRGKRFRLIIANRFPPTRLLKFYRILAGQCDRLLIEARESDMIKLPDGQTPLEKLSLFPIIREMANTLVIPLK